MDPESKKLLESNLRFTEENNKMLHSIRRSMRWASIMRFIYWAFIIGSAIGAYYFIQPYLTKALGLYNSVSGTEQKLGNGSNTIQDLLKKFGN